ncbi:MAG: hypothetical protein HKN33_08515, partial [Pyrinomonadaceae bacterium]|nr:hypothetical protein [Pyrinomonadaceae bacterium]
MAVTVSAQTDWTGEYFYGEDGGETVGGSKIYIAHTLKITEKGGKLKAHLSSQGFQTSIDIFADVNSRNGALEFIFRTVGPSHFLGTFRSGDLLFELVTQDGKMVTNWRKFKPVLERNHSAGSVRFEKVRLEPSASILREYLVPDSEVLVKIPNKTVVR